MSEGKFGSEFSFDAEDEGSEDMSSASARARNRTVMLSPEMTGQVRAMLQDQSSGEEKDSKGSQAASQKQGTFIPPVSEWQNDSEKESGESQSGRDRSTSVLDASAFSELDAAMDETFVEESDQMAASDSGIDFQLPSAESHLREDDADDDFLTPAVEKPQGKGSDSMGGDEFAAALSNLGKSIEEEEKQQEIKTAQTETAEEPEMRAELENSAKSGRPSAEAVPADSALNSRSQGSKSQESRSEERPAPAQGKEMQPAGGEQMPEHVWHRLFGAKSGAKLVALLLSYDKVAEGEIFEVRSGRFLLTSKGNENGAYLLVDDESVSPLHAIMKVQESGEVQVIDQLSEHGTAVTRAGASEEEEISDHRVELEHGDSLRLGMRNFTVVKIPQR